MTQEEFDRCFESYLSGSLGPDEARVLQASLQDPQWQQRWRELSDMDGMLAEEFKVQSQTVRGLRPPLRSSAMSRKRSRSTVQQSFSPQRWILAAVILLVATYGVLHYLRSENPSANVAQLKNVKGEVAILRGTERTPAQNNQTLTDGEGVLAGNGARATLHFQDGTQLTLSGAGESRVWMRAPDLSSPHGKQLTLEVGSLDAVVAPQPPSMPLVIHTATSQVKVLGTEFTLEATQASARLEVRTGRVRMQNIASGKSVEVQGGFFAVAAQTMEIAAKPIPPKVAVAPRALFNGKDFTGWNQTHGVWRYENGVVTGKGAPDKFARIESTQTFKRGELVCKMRVTGVRVAEVQFGGYREFFPLHWETLGVWKELRIRATGSAIHGTLDGEVLQMAQGGGESAPGILSFYVTANATLEIKDAYFTDATP